VNGKERRDALEQPLAFSRLEEVQDLLEETRQPTQALTNAKRVWLRAKDTRLGGVRGAWRASETGYRRLFAQDLPVDLRTQP
jgi:hypothetical protein